MMVGTKNLGSRFLVPTIMEGGGHFRQRAAALLTEDCGRDRILRSPHAHALIKGIDVSRAAALPGVKAVVTHEDTPGVSFGPITAFEDWQILVKDKVRFEGEEVAAAFSGSDLVIEHDYFTSQVYQAYMEPIAAVVRPETNGGFTMWLPIQIPNKSRLTYAKALGLAPEDIRVIKPFMGGAFGAKMESDVHLVCAVLARACGRPVRIALSRREDFVGGNPRVPMYIHLKTGFMRDGRFAAKEVEVIGANGGRTVYSPPIVATATMGGE